MEAYCLRPDSNHAIRVKSDDAGGHRVEHCFGAEIPPALDVHEDVDADCLRD